MEEGKVLTPTPMTAQLPTSLSLARLEAAQTVQARHDRRARDRQQRRRAVQRLLAAHAAEQHERERAAEHAHLHDTQRVSAAHDGALQQGSDQADEAEEAARVLCGVPEEVVGHKGEGEFHAGEEKDEGEVRGVEKGVGVCALPGTRGVGGGAIRVGGAVAVGELLAGGGGRGGAGEGFREAEVEVCGFADDEEEGETGGGGEGVVFNGLDGAEPGAEGGPEGEGYGEARADQGHGGPALGLVADVCRNGHGELDVALAQTADYSAREKGSEIGCRDPERDAEHVACH